MIRVIACSLVILSCIPAAVVADTFTYQGRLEQSGTSANGVHDFQFELWTALNAGDQVGATLLVENVPVVDGLFMVELDFTDPAAFDGNPRWLQIYVKADAEAVYTPLSPRQPIHTAPYAIHARTVGWVPDTALFGTYNGQLELTHPLNSFYGSGAGLTTLNASQLTTGSVPGGALNGTYGNPVTFTNGTFIGDGAGLINLDWGNLVNVPAGFADGVDNDSVVWLQNGSTAYYSAGHVGIGTSAPTHSLTINAPSQNALRLIGPLGSFGHGARLNFGDGDFAYIEEDQDDRLKFRSSRFAFENGSVGIGTDSPSQLLHIMGNMPSLLIENTADTQTSLQFRRPSDGPDDYSISVGGSGEMTTKVAGFEAITIRPSYRAVGVGVTAPAAQLHVENKDLSRPSLLAYHQSWFNDVPAILGVNRQQNAYGVGVEGRGASIGVLGSGTGSLDVGTQGGTRVGLWGETSVQNTYNYGVYAWADSGTENTGIYAYAPVGVGSRAAWFDGTVITNGFLGASGASLRIDHPLDPENKYLSHSVVQSPDMMNVYNGNVTTDATGYAVVTLPNWFSALNGDFRYQLTTIRSFSRAMIAEELDPATNTFVIRTEEPEVSVSWQITGVRQDAWAEANRIRVEEDKATANRGLYLAPKAFDQPPEMGIGWRHRREAMEASRQALAEQEQ